MTDLETASMQDLVDEIQKRYDSVVILCLRNMGTGKRDRFWMTWNGGLTPCEGLLDAMKRELAYVDRPDRRRR